MDYVISQTAYNPPTVVLWLRRLLYWIRVSLFSEVVDAPCPAVESKTAQTGIADVEEVLDNYGNSILRLAYSYLHNMCDAEDILQETLIKYLETTQSFESDNHKKAWLLSVAANLSKNRIDYNRIRQTDELEETLIMDEREDLSFVWDALKQLPSKYREVIHLFYHEGYQTKEISKILSRNESSVRSDLKRGRDKLKEVLRETYDFEI